MTVGLASLKHVRQAGNVAGVDATVLRQNSFLEPSDFPLKAFNWLKWGSHIIEGTTLYFGFPGGWLVGKKFACQCRRHGFNPWVEKSPWRRKSQPIPVFLPGKSHGQRNLAGYSPWGSQIVGLDLATKQQKYPLKPVNCRC